MALKKSFFFIFLLCAMYFGFEVYFNGYGLITVDEFWFAHRAYQFKFGIPYRDFAPYKTVLGYYFLLLPMLFSHGILSTLINIKNAIAVINTSILLISSYWLSRWFSKLGIFISLGILLTSQIMLFYSTNIRVDLFGYWFGLFSLLCLCNCLEQSNKKFALLAGIFLGLGFACTQKVIWYWTASNAALGCVWLYRKYAREMIYIGILFNLSMAAVIAMYLITWASLSSWHTVVSSVFLEASAMYHLDWYANLRQTFWQFLLLYNPLLFALWPLTIFSLFIRYSEDKTYLPRLFVVIYSLVILMCLIPYKQIFPYYLQVILPVLFVTYASFFSWLLGLFNTASEARLIGINNITLWCLAALYLGIFVTALVFFELPFVNLFICTLPLVICLLASKTHFTVTDKTTLLKITFSVLIFTSIISPYTNLAMALRIYDGRYQKANLLTMQQLLQSDGSYLAGIELFYDRDQPIPGLRHLMAPAIAYLYHPTPDLQKVMLASLYEDPHVTTATVLNALKTANVKFYVNNYRIAALPPAILNFLHHNYAHWWGSIYLYAPTVEAGNQQIILKFSGNYQLESTNKQTVNLISLSTQNKLHVTSSDIIYLSRGDYETLAKHDFRLKFIPALSNVNPNFAMDKPNHFLF